MVNLNEMIPKKKVVLWDFDGCFCDSEPIHYQAYAQAFLKYGHIINKDEYFETFTHTGGGISKEIANYNLTCNPHDIRIAKADYYWQLIDRGEAKLFPEMADILIQLQKNNIKSVIASNSPEEEIRLILSKLNNKIEIENIFGLSAGLRKKPFPDIFNHALSSLKIPSSEALVIEDSERGLLAAKAAHCDAIWIKTYLTEVFNSTAPYLAKITHAELLKELEHLS